MTFGDKLRALRIERDLTQRDLAERLGVSFTYLSKLENDRMEHPPSEELIYKLAQELEADPDNLLVLARRVPTDVAKTIIDNPESIEILRSMSKMGREEWLEMVREAKRRSDGR